MLSQVTSAKLQCHHVLVKKKRVCVGGGGCIVEWECLLELICRFFSHVNYQGRSISNPPVQRIGLMIVTENYQS